MAISRNMLIFERDIYSSSWLQTLRKPSEITATKITNNEINNEINNEKNIYTGDTLSLADLLLRKKPRTRHEREQDRCH